MAVDDYLHVAWQADRDGNQHLREAMLTLAVAFAAPGETWPERCRARLLRDRPSHFFGHHPTLPESLADPRVQHSLQKLRARNPLSRVRFLRLRSEASTGRYTGRPTPISILLDDLLAPPPAPTSMPRPFLPEGREVMTPVVSGPAPTDSDESVEEDPITALLVTFLLAVAMLLIDLRLERGQSAA
jgi:hypothetical protein